MKPLKSPHREQKRQPDERADREHPHDRPQTEAHNVKGSDEPGLDRAEDKQHQGRAAG